MLADASREHPAAGAAEALVEVRGLTKSYPVRKGLVIPRVVGEVRAVDNVSFPIYKGETLGLMGESGCGKTTVGRLIMGLIEPTAGEVLYAGKRISGLSHDEMLPYRRKMAIIFQDPYSSLNPRKTIGNIIMDPMKRFRMFATERQMQERVLELLDKVGLDPNHANRYPHEFSGGQRQRIGIARALAGAPEFVVLDEPVSALDVSIQAQVLNLLQDLQSEFGLTYLFIANNLNVVEYIADRVAVMHKGQVVELAQSHELYSRPQHPHTRHLLSSILTLHSSAEG